MLWKSPAEDCFNSHITVPVSAEATKAYKVQRCVRDQISKYIETLPKSLKQKSGHKIR